MKITDRELWLYVLLSKLPRPKSYEGKIMCVAFLGTHVPLLALLVYFLVINSFSLETTLRVLLIALVATLIGTGVTLYALHKLLAPIILTYLAQRAYINQKKLPNLPTKYTDEVGILMADTVQTIHKLDEAIDHLTNYDAITSLPNRVLFGDRLQQALLRNQERNQLLAVMALKLNNFREINNALGSDAADRLLRVVAERLSANISTLDMLSRIGSDEFAIALTELTASEDVVEFCRSVLNSLALPINLYGDRVNTVASIGIAIYPFDGNTVDRLLQSANTAVDEAYRQMPNNYQFYSANMNAQLQERLALESKLRYALQRNELQLYYQPRVDTNTGRIVSVEALLRWQNPELGLISPTKFIPIAEANGSIVPIGEWVLRTACTQNRLWQESVSQSLRVAVNLSARQLAQPNLVERIASILKETQLNPAYLELEVTESLMMENLEQSISVLEELRELGVKLALDDFGTGYSSLNYLRRFPLHTLKIDRSFVRDVVSNSHNGAVTNAIITLAKSLDLNITAEGVETQEQCEYVKAQGCHEIQGYYFSPPIPTLAMTALLKKAERFADWEGLRNLISS
ncbi:putative bifunctional diguanylate cyclase/phosphodiesterase [Argonema antarcticum]|uniref:putative bifunctional diguanylate cyclase/phosphodiesterase n=1 Tax=Argonema antarcticum TaxID=2942763 RepID=UPI002011CE63|nr:GGDEF domain-containing phosphodiesterase [Argonema antarcticum]MCL1472434.1 EAL domain-containing protein [Argonema antarcticum A004/B2]